MIEDKKFVSVGLSLKTQLSALTLTPNYQNVALPKPSSYEPLVFYTH